MNTYLIYVRRVYGPIGRDQDWRLAFVKVDEVQADDEIHALHTAKAAGWPAPVVRTQPVGRVS